MRGHNEQSGKIVKVSKIDILDKMSALEGIFDEVAIIDSVEQQEVGLARVRRSCKDICPIYSDGSGCLCGDAISSGECISRFVTGDRTAHLVMSKAMMLGTNIVNMVMILNVDHRFSFGTYSIGDEVEKIVSISSTLVVDQLTKIYNRKFLEDKKEAWVQKARRKNEEMCLASIDIDNFKRFNDTYGHDFGDKVLVTLARCMEEAISGMNGVYPIRVGGDEFLVICTDNVSKKRFTAVMTKLCEIVKDTRLEFKEEKVGITISIGVSALLEDRLNEYREMYEAADRALYKAKEAGKNCVR